MDIESDNHSELTQLKSILLGEEKQRIDQLEHITKVERNKENERFRDYLNSELQESETNSKSTFRQSYSRLFPKALKSEIQNNPSTIIDSLYPVIGNIVGKYVRESIKEAMESINEKVESQLPIEAMKRKISAKLKGVSEEEYLFLETQKIAVNGVLLIEKGSGIIIYSNFDEVFKNVNEDLFAGLLMALQSFGQDGIDQASKGQLNSIDYGENKILIESAGSVFVAVIVKGNIAVKLLKKINLALSNVLTNHRSFITDYNGDTSTVPEAMKEKLNELLINQQETKENKKNTTKKKKIGLLCLLLLGALLVWRYYYLDKTKKMFQQTIESNYYFKNIKIESGLFTGTKVIGRIKNQNFRDHFIDLMAKNESLEKINTDQIIIDAKSSNPIEDQLKKLENRLSGLTGILIKVAINDRIHFSGFCKNKAVLDEFKAIVHSEFSNIPINLSKVITDPSYFSLSLSYKSGHIKLAQVQKEKLFRFIKANKNNYKLTIHSMSNQSGSFKGRKSIIQNRTEQLKTFIKNNDPKIIVLDEKYSLDFMGIVFNKKELSQLVDPNESVIILRRDFLTKIVDLTVF